MIKEKYLGCSKGGLPQLAYSGMYTTVHGTIVVSHLSCSVHMNLASIGDELLLTLLNEQPIVDGCICTILALLVNQQVSDYAQEEQIIVYSDYICVNKHEGCWKTKRDYSDECCPEKMVLAKRGEGFVKIEICACSVENWRYTKLWFEDLKQYKKYINWAMMGVVYTITARSLGKILAVAYFVTVVNGDCHTDI
jgi:hypothetical protein